MNRNPGVTWSFKTSIKYILLLFFLIGDNEIAAGVNTRVCTPSSPADDQEVPKSDEMKVLCSCGYNGVRNLSRKYKITSFKFYL